MIILRYHEISFRLTACPGMAAGAVSLRKSHDIIILSFCNIVKGQAKCLGLFLITRSQYKKSILLKTYFKYIIQVIST